MKHAVDRAMAEATLRELAHVLGEGLPPGVGFAVTLFNFTDDPDAQWSTYVSNAKREDIVALLRELAERIEGERGRLPMVGVPTPGTKSS